MTHFFNLVICVSTDTGKKRQNPTSSPDIIEKNTDNFLRNGEILKQMKGRSSQKCYITLQKSSLCTCAWDVYHSY